MSQVVLATPLDALGLIEASAGTGKTHTLAGLFARAVIAQRRAVPDVLAVTFTIRATQELHERVRGLLLRAAELAARWRDGDPARRAGDAAGTALLRQLIHDALADGGESLSVLRRRLARAAREMDQAAITTIHGFCQRVLGEHALETGQLLRPAEVVTNLREAREAIAVELWREWNARADDNAWLRKAYTDPSGLADALDDLMAPEALLPVTDGGCARHARRRLVAAAGDVPAARRARAAADRGRHRRQDPEFRQKDDVVPVAALREWFSSQGARGTVAALRGLVRLSNDYLLSICGKNKEAAVPLRRCSTRSNPTCGLRSDRSAAPARAARPGHRPRPRAQARLPAARLRRPDRCDARGGDRSCSGPRLCAAVRAQFPLALIDEFQDTDARQWTIFEHLFGGSMRRAACCWSAIPSRRSTASVAATCTPTSAPARRHGSRLRSRRTSVRAPA